MSNKKPVAWISPEYIKTPTHGYSVSPTQIATQLVPLYLDPSPPADTQAPLTSGHIWGLWESLAGLAHDSSMRVETFARDIEKAHGIKHD